MSQPQPPPAVPPAAPGAPASIAPEIVSAFAHAQARTLRLAAQTLAELQAGTAPAAALAALESAARADGFTGWFAAPRVLVNGRGDVDLARAPRPGALVELSLAPLDTDAFGAFASTVQVGGGEDAPLLREARDLCRSTCGFASRWKSTGELFVYATSWANNRRKSLGDATEIGHLCFPRRGRAGWVWPYAARAAVALRRHQIQWLNPRRMRGHFFVYPRLHSEGVSAGFGELIVVDGDLKAVVGRAAPGAAATPPA